jgi:hypothetical protein
MLFMGGKHGVEAAAGQHRAYRGQVADRVDAGGRTPVEPVHPAAPPAQGERVAAHHLDPHAGATEHRHMLARRQA